MDKYKTSVAVMALTGAIEAAGKVPPSEEVLVKEAAGIAREILYIQLRYMVTRSIVFLGSVAIIAALFGLDPFKVCLAAVIVNVALRYAPVYLKSVEQHAKLDATQNKIDALVENLPNAPFPHSTDFKSNEPRA